MNKFDISILTVAAVFFFSCGSPPGVLDVL
jgi:hypothetical protein